MPLLLCGKGFPSQYPDRDRGSELRVSCNAGHQEVKHITTEVG